MIFVPTLPQAIQMRAPRVRPIPVLQGALLLLLVANLGRIPLLATGVYKAPILVNDIAVGLVLAAGIFAALQSRSLRLDSVALAALAFAAVGGASAIAAVPRFGLTTGQLVVSLAYLVRWLVYFGVYVVIVNWGRASDVKRLWRAAETMLLIMAGFGLVQSAFLPGFAQIVAPDGGWDVQGYRLVSTVLDPNVVGAMFVIGILVQLALIAAGARVKRWKPGLLLVALAVTLSRSAVLGLLAGGIAILVARGLSVRLMRLVGVVSAVLVLALPAIVHFGNMYDKFDTGGSAAVRLITLALALSTFVQHPIIGIGFNTWGYVAGLSGEHAAGSAAFSSDGGLLFIAVMTGLVGACIYMAMLWLVVRRCRSIWRSPFATPDERGFAIGAMAVTVAIVVDSIFINTILTTFIMELLWVVWGFGFVFQGTVAARACAAESRFHDRDPSAAPQLVQLSSA